MDVASASVQPATVTAIRPKMTGRQRSRAFLTIVLSGQIVYSAFEAFKGSLLLPFQNMLGVSATEFGILMSYIGLAMFMYIPAGWINNRFKVKTIIVWALAGRLVTSLFVFLVLPPFWALTTIAVVWAALDAIMWPAVVNGVSIMSGRRQKKGLAMGLLESIRRLVEFLMNGAVIIAMLIWSEEAPTILRVAAIAYTLLIVPMMICVYKFVPDTKTATEVGKSDAEAALRGLVRVLARPRIWLAGIAALTVYWSYINLMYISAPYLLQVFNVEDGLAASFGIFNTGVVGIAVGIVSGFLADYVFRSSSLMMAVSLALVVVACAAVLVIPVSQSAIWPVLLLLMLVAIAVFLGKSVILAPIAELNLPEEVSGSALAVGSFFAYSSVLWAYPLNGMFVDASMDNAAASFDAIFMMTLGAATIGCLAAIVLVIVNHVVGQREAGLEVFYARTAHVV